MKKLQYVLGIGLLIPVFSSLPVMAVEGSSKSTESEKSTSATTTATTTTTTTKVEDPGMVEPTVKAEDATKRLEALKSAAKLTLKDADKKRLLLKCKPAQTILEKTESTDKQSGMLRNEAYNKIVEKLTSLIAKVEAAGVDATTLKNDLTTLQTKIATFNTDLNAYRQTVSDLRNLNCATDPTAFQAALTQARTQREKVRNDALDIRAFVTGTLKTDLQAVKAKLEALKTDDKTGGNQ